MSVDEMQSYYGKRAAVYDESMGYNEPRKVARLAPVIEQITQLLAGRAILEIACGTGFWTQFISKKARSILATDFNQSTLDQAGLKNLPSDKVSLKILDAYDLSEVPRNFDAAYAGDWLSHVPKKRMPEFLRGLHHCLNEGARVVFCDQLPREHSLTGIYDQEGNHLQERVLPDGSRYQVIKHFMSDEEIRFIFSQFAEELEILRFPECQRLVVTYRLAGQSSR